jgi:hypothetical protein
MGKHRPEARPTPKMIRLYHQFVRRWGEPTDLIVFDARENEHPVKLPLLLVPVWAADRRCEVTALNTLGMSDRRMRRVRYFAELHLAYRGRLRKPQRLNLARFLADVAEYPFENNVKLDWWEVILNPGRIPEFPGCRHLLLHPRFVPEGLDKIGDDDGPIKLLYVVPITPRERHLLVDHGRECFLEYVEEEGVDLLADRQDEAKWYETTG